MRESFSMVQNILFVCYIKVLPSVSIKVHQWENILEKLWETMQFFLIVDFGGSSWRPYSQHPLLSGGYRPG